VGPTGNIIAWSNQNPVAVVPNTNYTFSYYVASVSPDSPAKLEVKINGVSQGTPVTAPGATCLWTQVSYDWNSGSNTTANFAIYDRNAVDYGNDFALDDITLKETVTCLYQKTVTVTVTPGTTPTFNAVNPICSGTTLTALPTTSNNGITGTWSPALNNTATTIYTFTPTTGQCASIATLTITVNAPSDFTISEDCDGVSYTLNAVQINASSSLYAWFDAAGTQIGTGSSVVIATPGVYELVITQNGCSARESITVASATCGGMIQRGISPNNDGLNDYFDLQAFNVKELKIFNRYGTNVYSKANYQNEWYGQSDNGNELPDGTYYYVIDFADLKTKTGWIYRIQ
jgi:gliding motility-associated-like protein